CPFPRPPPTGDGGFPRGGCRPVAIALEEVVPCSDRHGSGNRASSASGASASTPSASVRRTTARSGRHRSAATHEQRGYEYSFHPQFRATHIEAPDEMSKPLLSFPT